MKFLIIIGLALSATSSLAESGPFLKQVKAWTSQPVGHYEFCGKNPDQCQTKTNGKHITLTEARWIQIQDVNHKYNKLVRGVTDPEIHNGKEEVWTLHHELLYVDDLSRQLALGDCEDYILSKRHELIKKYDFPVSSLITAVVLDENRAPHAVLVVRTDRGDFILDNLVSEIKLWSATPYTFLKGQSPFHTGRWQCFEVAGKSCKS